jgi:hypothetical protein
MMPDFVLLRIRGIKILPFISLPFGYLDCEPKVVIYRITLLVSELLVDLCKCECNRMNGSSLVISQLLLIRYFAFLNGSPVQWKSKMQE